MVYFSEPNDPQSAEGLKPGEIRETNPKQTNLHPLGFRTVNVSAIYASIKGIREFDAKWGSLDVSFFVMPYVGNQLLEDLLKRMFFI